MTDTVNTLDNCLQTSWTLWFTLTLFIQKSSSIFHTGHRLWLTQAATNPLSDCPGQLKILLGNQKFKVLCPNGQLKSKQGTECELKFVIIFDILTDVYMTFYFKQVEGVLFVGSMSQREGVGSTSNFSMSSNFGFKSRARSGNWYTVSGCPMGLPLEKNLSQPGLTQTWHFCWGENANRVRSSNLSQALRHRIVFA